MAQQQDTTSSPSPQEAGAGDTPSHTPGPTRVCGLCGAAKLSDMSYFRPESVRHFSNMVRRENIICHACWGHKWEGKWYTKAEWDAWINEKVSAYKFKTMGRVLAALSRAGEG